MKHYFVIFLVLLLGLGVYRWREGSKEASKEPEVIRIWVSGETQKQLFYEQKEKPFLVWITSANSKVVSPSGISYDPQFRPRWITLDSPGGLAGGYQIIFQWPGKEGANDKNQSLEFPKGTFCFEYKLPDDNQFVIGSYLRPMECPK